MDLERCRFASPGTKLNQLLEAILMSRLARSFSSKAQVRLWHWLRPEQGTALYPAQSRQLPDCGRLLFFSSVFVIEVVLDLV